MRREAVFVEGGFTPAEIASAVRSAGAAKVFPAHVGGPRFIRSLTAVLPGALLIPTGGIRLGAVRAWLDAGAAAVGIGAGLPDDPGELAAVFAASTGWGERGGARADAGCGAGR
ncbi:hypothetical protein AB0B01_03650 [Streptomyces sp. NPDC044571]|uniref:hypothetical protein n=1 Tax=Streptomyces sp. NPDC044571 TaxID=3155371 RepID=UPI0034100D30